MGAIQRACVSIAAMEHLEEYNAVEQSTVSPEFLNANSTSHTTAFGAIAELIDTAVDPDVSAHRCDSNLQQRCAPCIRPWLALIHTKRFHKATCCARATTKLSIVTCC